MGEIEARPAETEKDTVATAILATAAFAVVAFLVSKRKAGGLRERMLGLLQIHGPR